MTFPTQGVNPGPPQGRQILYHLSYLGSRSPEVHKPTLAKMNEKPMLLKSFFEKVESPNDETAEDSKAANKKKAAFKRKY